MLFGVKSNYSSCLKDMSYKKCHVLYADSMKSGLHTDYKKQSLFK